MLEGEITFYVGEETYEAAPCTFESAPCGVPHSYTFGTDVIRMLVLVAPGGFETFFRPPQSSEPAQALEVPPPAEGPPDVPAIVVAREHHGVKVVGPPDHRCGVANPNFLEPLMAKFGEMPFYEVG